VTYEKLPPEYRHLHILFKAIDAHMLVCKTRNLRCVKSTPFPALAAMVRNANRFTLTQSQLFQMKAVSGRLISIEWVWRKNHFEMAVEGIGANSIMHDGYTAEHVLQIRE
jgi:hypothetical protein